LTAAATQQHEAEALAAGMNAHLAKPIDQQQLLNVLAELIETKPIMRQMAYDRPPPLMSGQDSEEVAIQLERIAAQLQAHEAICQSRLNAICEMIAGQFSLTHSQKLARCIEQYDYANALIEIRAMISLLNKPHAN